MPNATAAHCAPAGRRPWAWLGLLLLIFPALVSALPSRQGTATFTTSAPRDTLFTLPVMWVELDSIQVLRNENTQTEYVDWRVAEPGNRIWLYRPLGPSDTLRVTYVYRPIPLYRTYLRHSLREIGRESAGMNGARDSTRVVPAFAPESESPQGWSRLNKSGSLIRSVQIGTGQDLALESALNIQIQGRVGRNIDVVAALTDQTTPIQPEGTTETLNELEKVFVSVRTPKFATTLGDYTLTLPGGVYDAYSRKLTGVLAEADLTEVKMTAGAAVSRGQFFTNSFNGQEANQGPYPLQGRNGETGLVILAGTEKVWLDGEQLRRGEGNDYTMDYAAGEVTFTSRRVITSETRIVVDFEYSNEDYERFYGAGRVEGALGDNRLGGGFTYITESDDRTRPIGTGLSDTDKAVLAAAGDQADSAVAFAADSVGTNGADYIRLDSVYAGVSYSIFAYSPKDTLGNPTGQWRVLFDDFGAGHGDYEAAADTFGNTYFRWVGPDRGRYDPYRRLALPGAQTLGDMRGHVEPIKGVRFSGELALSKRDLNTFSTRDDGDNNGAAYTGALDFSRDSLSLGLFTPARIEGGVRVRHRDARFREMTRTSEIEFQRDWDAPVNAGTAETIRESNLRISPVRNLTLSGGYGDLERGGTFSSSRRTAGANATVLRRWILSASLLNLNSDDRASGRQGKWNRESGRLSGAVKMFAPRAGVDREQKRDRTRGLASGFRFLDYYAGTGVQLPANFSVDGEYRRRTDERLVSTNQFIKSAVASTVASEAAWNPPEGGRTLLRYTHREKKYFGSDSADVTTDVGRLETLIVPRSRLFEANAVYEVAKTRSQSQILVAVQVPPGTGQYRREGDRYVADDQGDFILVPRYTGSYEPATDLSLSAQVWLRPDELQDTDLSPALRALSAETEVVLEERTRLPLSVRLLMLDQSQFRGDSTLSGTVTLRQDLNVWRLSQKLALRLRYRESQSLQNQYLNGGQERVLREGGARVRARYVGPWRGESEGIYSRETLKYASGIFPNRDINRFDLTQSNTVTLSTIWEAGADLRISEATDDRTQTTLSLRELRPHAALTLFGKGRMDADASWIHATSNRSLIPYELGRGANRGENLRWSLRGTYQFGQNFSGTVDYTARKDAGEQIYHSGRLEVRASF